jgi:hypothetical protein
MKNILQENMHRFGTKNLQEQESNVQTPTGKELRKQGYKVYHGIPLQDPLQYVVDPKLRVVSQFKSAGGMQLTNKLTSEQNRRFYSGDAQIVFRDLKNGNVELQYVEVIE